MHCVTDAARCRSVGRSIINTRSNRAVSKSTDVATRGSVDRLNPPGVLLRRRSADRGFDLASLTLFRRPRRPRRRARRTARPVSAAGPPNRKDGGGGSVGGGGRRPAGRCVSSSRPIHPMSSLAYRTRVRAPRVYGWWRRRDVINIIDKQCLRFTGRRDSVFFCLAAWKKRARGVPRLVAGGNKLTCM